MVKYIDQYFGIECNILSEIYQIILDELHKIESKYLYNIYKPPEQIYTIFFSSYTKVIKYYLPKSVVFISDEYICVKNFYEIEWFTHATPRCIERIVSPIISVDIDNVIQNIIDHHENK